MSAPPTSLQALLAAFTAPQLTATHTPPASATASGATAQPAQVVTRAAAAAASIPTAATASIPPASASIAPPPLVASATAHVDALSARIAAASAAAAAAPPRAFSSHSHDEFSSANQRKSDAAARGGGVRGPAARSTGPGATPHAGTTIYRSPLSSRPLVRTLTALLSALVGHTVRVELRNESWIRGKLEEVDAQGNMRMSNAVAHRPAGHMPPGPATAAAAAAAAAASHSPSLDHLFVPGRSVRYVLLPDRVDGAALLTAHETRLDSALLEFKRRKRAGKFTTREQQVKDVERKQAKLAEEMRLQQDRQQQQQTGTGTGTGTGSRAPSPAMTGSEERDPKRQRQ